MSTYETSTPTGAIAASGSASHGVALDGESFVKADLSWTQGQRNTSSPFSGTVAPGATNSHTINPTAVGTITASVDWSPATQTQTINDSVADLGQDDHLVTVSANGTVSAILTWPQPGLPNPNPNLDLYLVDSSGNTVGTPGTQLTGNSESISYTVSGLGAYPASRTYYLRVKAVATGSSYTLTETHPVTANVDLELYNPSGTKVAQATSTSAKPESISYTMPAGTSGNHTLKVVSKDHSAPYSLSSTYPVLAYADLTLNLKNPAGTTVATSRSSSGSTSLSYHAPSAGGYSVQVVNNSTDVGVPSLTATSRTPRTHFANVKVQLKDNSGAVVAEDTTSARPKTVSATVSTGRYTWVTTALTGSGTATLTGTYPSRPLNQIIGYNANDHAISIDDGTTKTDETLSPGGRVLRR
ncbi:MAG: hypothetical protein ACREEO_01550, partial [Phenylobacterium sp.]